MGLQIRAFNATVTTAGTRQRLFGTSNLTIAKWVRVSLDTANMGAGDEAVVGDETVVAVDGSQVGFPVSRGSSEREGAYLPGPIALASIWIDAQQNGTKVCGTYLPIYEAPDDGEVLEL